ncbi:ketoacyl-ACP synthase III [Kitasatospora sp. NBC_01287]|uniref:beta-ketoacyl-ACP synthase III n=1 Tax=Kitasatospora sp. NBC_01287 TaxID=2903573 RepID=UPI0022503860|nr:beta-ketoacyl-ACP synthase III [Kitasatospora sp. NBC_01287]MCX4747730.1 ketoacyl-ACP synthase III [Kitasatospora sp. NBC_01287]
MSRAAVLAGLGAVVPPREITNQMLSERLDTTDAWIRTRTGILKRHAVEPGGATSDLAVEAGGRALKSAGLDAVDLVVLATATPDHPLPGTAPEVAARLGLGQIPAFDVAAVCAGFVYALSVGAGAIAARTAESVLVIGAEAFTSILDPQDRGTAILFGDGAGAVVLRAGQDDEPGALLGFDLGSDGSLADLIVIPGGGSRQRSGGLPPDQDTSWFTMQGREVFTQAVTHMSKSTRSVLAKVDWPVETVDRIVGHQANVRILHSVSELLGIPKERAVVHLDQVGNTSAASIPLALAAAAERGELLPGHRVALTAFGGGLAWGSAALVWPDVTVG